jgi:sec-independent protein translocase protein TatB
MFDVSLIELAVIALVALLVLGPEKLPRAARTVGLYVRKAKQSWYSVRADIERELAADELRRSLEQAGDSVREATALPALDARQPVSAAGGVAPAPQDPATPQAADEPPRDAPPAA